MPVDLRYRGKAVTAEDILFIRQLIAENPPPESSETFRKTLRSVGLETGQRRVARHGLPRSPADAASGRRDRTARGAAGLAESVCAKRETATGADRQTPLTCALADSAPPFQQVRRTSDEPLFNSLMEQHHYLGYEQPVGEHLKYLVWAQGRPIACMAWSSAPRHLGSRDRHIGWSAEARRRNIRFVAYNTRFLILPWVEVPHLASHILGRIASSLPNDWEQLYGHPVYFAETFIDPGRFRGTCYRAANWKLLGLTTGRGKDSTSKRPNRSIKEVLGYPLTPRFRELLSQS